MKTNRKCKLNDCNNFRSSLNSTPLRQMSITESFKYTKPKVFKMNTPFDVSRVCIVIDSDSDSESPQTKKDEIQVKMENNMEESQDIINSDIPSPSKKRKLMIGVNKPSASMSTLQTSTVTEESPYTQNMALDLSTGSNEITSHCSREETVLYDFAVFDEDTMPFTEKNADPASDNNEERLIMNDPCDEDAVSVFDLQNYFSTRPEVIASENNNIRQPMDNMTASQKCDTLDTCNLNNNGRTAAKINVQGNYNNYESTSVTEVKSKTRNISLNGTELKYRETIDAKNKNFNNIKFRDAIPSVPTINLNAELQIQQNKEFDNNGSVAPKKKARPRKRKIPETNIVTEKIYRTDNSVIQRDTSPDQRVNSMLDKFGTPNSKNYAPIPKILAQNDQSPENTKEKILMDEGTARKAQTDGDIDFIQKNKFLSMMALNSQTSIISPNKEVGNSSKLKIAGFFSESATTITPVITPKTNSKKLLTHSNVPPLTPINVAQELKNSISQSQSAKVIRKTYFSDNQRPSNSKSLGNEFSNQAHNPIVFTSQSNNDSLAQHSQTENPTSKKKIIENQQPCGSESLDKEISNQAQYAVIRDIQRNNDTSIKLLLTKTSTPKKKIIDDQQPCCSKSLHQAQVTVIKDSPKSNNTSYEHSQTKNITPKKNIGQQKTCSSKSLKKKNSNQAQHIVIKESPKSYNTSAEHSQTKNSTPKKNNDQQPCCSKSLGKEISDQTQRDNATPKKNNMELERNDSEQFKGSMPAEKLNGGNSANQNTNSSTPEKQTSAKGFSGDKGSPKNKVSKSPENGSPIKRREIKSFKSKEGKQLHTRQLDELVKLFKMVTSTRHLKSFLDDFEQKKITTFLSMEENIQYVLMKLFVWQRQFYSIYAFCSKAQIQFNDDKDVMDMFDYLREEEFIDTDYRKLASLAELLDKLHDVKIKEIMDELKIKPIKTKSENVGKLLTLAGTQSTLTRTKTFKDLILDKVEKKMGVAFRIKNQVFDTFHHVYLLATFANPALDDIQIYFKSIIYDKVVFPETSIEDYRVFYSRSEFRHYCQALKLYNELDGYLSCRASEKKPLGIYKCGLEAYRQLQDLITENAQEQGSSENDELPHLKRFTAQHVYCKILSSCCKNLYTKHNGHSLEVKKWLEFLIDNFSNSKRIGQWYHTLIQLHMRHLDNISYEKAAKLLIRVLDTKKDILGDISKYELGALGKPLKSSRKHKIDQLFHDRVAKVIPKPIDTDEFPKGYIDAQCIRSEIPGRKRKYINKSGDEVVYRDVEQVALNYYAENGYPGGEHCEGQLIKAMLMLCFWDIIYNPPKFIPGTFISPLQTAPLDMFTTSFYKNRKDLIEERLEEIRTGWSEKDLIDFAVTNWREHSHERAAFGTIMNIILEEAMVEVLIVVIGRKILAAVLERLIKNISEFGKGMPDLLIWNVDKEYCKFVEVKGEGDKLSNAQKLWLQYLKRIGASIEVCHVHSMGSKRKKIKKVLTEDNADHDKDQSKES